MTPHYLPTLMQRTCESGAARAALILSGNSADPARDLRFLCGAVRRMVIIFERAGFPTKINRMIL